MNTIGTFVQGRVRLNLMEKYEIKKKLKTPRLFIRVIAREKSEIVYAESSST